jgi:hypothetical protein
MHEIDLSQFHIGQELTAEGVFADHAVYSEVVAIDDAQNVVVTLSLEIFEEMPTSSAEAQKRRVFDGFLSGPVRQKARLALHARPYSVSLSGRSFFIAGVTDAWRALFETRRDILYGLRDRDIHEIVHAVQTHNSIHMVRV